MRGPATVRIYVLVTSVLKLILLLYLIHFLGGNPLDMWVVDSHGLHVMMIYQNWIFGFALAVIVESTAIKSLQLSAKVVRIHGD